MIQKVLLGFTLIMLGACGIATTRPKLEISLAATAFIAAKEAKAQVHAANYYRKAEFYYLKAKSAYRRKYFNKAKQYSILSRKFSEKAEYQAIKKVSMEPGLE